MLDQREAFKRGFLASCADLGLSSAETINLAQAAVKRAGAFGTLLHAPIDMIKTFGPALATTALVAGAGLPIAGGALIGKSLASAHDNERGVDEAKADELISEYRRLTDQARRRSAFRRGEPYFPGGQKFGTDLASSSTGVPGGVSPGAARLPPSPIATVGHSPNYSRLSDFSSAGAGAIKPQSISPRYVPMPSGGGLGGSGRGLSQWTTIYQNRRNPNYTVPGAAAPFPSGSAGSVRGAMAPAAPSQRDWYENGQSPISARPGVMP